MLTLKHPTDFYKHFGTIAPEVNQNQEPLPMSDEEIDKIQLTRWRNGAEAVDVPPSVRTVLRYDRNFTLWGGQPLLASLFRSEAPVVPSATIDEPLRWTLGPMFDGLPEDVPVWTSSHPMPGLHRITHGGDQWVYLYIGEPDELGEYPIARYDTQPEVWISNGSFIDYVVSAMLYFKASFDITYCMDTQAAQAQARNVVYTQQEWWDTNPQLKAYMDAF
ncbi:MAG: DUF5066 family protein [Deltaproteobacteria bacterium]|nr:MAG: DUF5066 family protein [Deltaproteobacteria bacterium]